MMHLFWLVFGIGLVYAASPGPVNVETMRRGLRGGVRAALLVQCGSILASLALGGAMLLGSAPILARPALQQVFALAGAVVLLWIAWTALHDTQPVPSVTPRSLVGRRSLGVGIVCTACNPLSPLIWLTIAGVSTASGAAMQIEQLIVVAAAYLLSKLAWAVLLAALLGWGHIIIRPRVWRWWNIISACVLAGYGVHLFWSTIR